MQEMRDNTCTRVCSREARFVNCRLTAYTGVQSYNEGRWRCLGGVILPWSCGWEYPSRF